jgi:hypothetical protein
MSAGQNLQNPVATGLPSPSAKKNARRWLRTRAERGVDIQMTPRFEIPQASTDRSRRSLIYNKFRNPSVSNSLTGSETASYAANWVTRVCRPPFGQPLSSEGQLDSQPLG